MWGEEQVSTHVLVSDHWDGEGKFTASAGLAFHPDAAAHLLNQADGNGIAPSRLESVYVHRPRARISSPACVMPRATCRYPCRLSKTQSHFRHGARSG